MDAYDIQKVLKAGEGVSIEFKRCGNGPQSDTFETICSFANHSGGNIYLGIDNSAEVVGVPQGKALEYQRHIINIINNPNVFKPAVPVEFEEVDCDGRTILRVWIPCDAFVHSYKNKIYDRQADSDIALALDAQIGSLYLKKQALYTEQAVYPYVSEEDLDLSILLDVRKRAEVKRPGHSWGKMTDEELLRSAGLYTKNYSTGESGFNLAAVLLLGRADVIGSIVPAYKTDAIVRIDNTDRFDDREVVKTNLLRAYPLLEDFCKRNIRDRFYLEDGVSVSPRDIIIRELLSNLLIHREYSSAYPARIVISEDEIVTENGSRAQFEGPLNLSSFSPMPKNPIIAAFFNNIGLADELGSGARNLLKYTKVYSGGVPTLFDGSVFRALVPISRKNSETLVNSDVAKLVSKEINLKGYVTTVDIRDGLQMDHKAAQRELAKLVQSGVVAPVGNTKGRRYIPLQ